LNIFNLYFSTQKNKTKNGKISPKTFFDRFFPTSFKFDRSLFPVYLGSRSLGEITCAFEVDVRVFGFAVGDGGNFVLCERRFPVSANKANSALRCF
jgi:hypothetical protein